MFTWTETPLVDLWNHLRYLGSPANVTRLLSGEIKSGRHNALYRSNSLDKRAYEIADALPTMRVYRRLAG